MVEKKSETCSRQRLALSKIRQIANQAKEASKEKREEVKERRSKRRIPSFDVNILQKDTTVLNSNTVRDWFKSAMDRNFGDKVSNPSKTMAWVTNGKQGMLAKKMLKEYHPDVVKKSVDYICDHWDMIVSNSGGKLTGLPSIELLWSMRGRVFPDAERGIAPVAVEKKKKKHMVGEYDPADAIGAPDAGW